MEITIEKKNYISELSDEDKKKGHFIQEYLENSYKIKKQGTVYLLKKKSNKILIDESTIHKMYKGSFVSNNKYQNVYIIRFLLKSLHNNWALEKKQNNYLLSKKHHGKKEYFSPDFLSGFMENNF